MDIAIEGFKSLKKIKMNDLAKVNYLVGENASGKSSILECLQIFNAALESGVRSSSFGISGITKHAFRDTAFKFSIHRQTGRTIEMQLANEASLQQNGQVNHDNELITIDGQAMWTYHDAGGRRDALLAIEGFSISTAYVSTIKEKDSGYYIHPTFMDFNFGEIDIASSDHLIAFLNKYYPHANNRRIESISRSMRSDNAIMLRLAEKSIHNKRAIYYVDSEEYVPIASLSGGLRSMLRLYYGIETQLRDIAVQENLIRIICIEEPEVGFHPRLQKEIPGILQDFISRYPDVVFFVTTHSPFISSSASKFSKTQKMYLFDKGSLVDLSRDNVAESDGYKGDLCLNVVARMLGAGFNDLGSMPHTNEQFTVIYCEGADKDLKDSILYKKIFADKNIIFISSSDLANAVYAFRLGLEGARFMLGKETQVKALVDRSFGCRVKNCGKSQGTRAHSHIFPLGKESVEKTYPGKPIFTDEERQTIMATDKQGRIKMLLRKEIENYLFDPAVIAFLSEAERALIEVPDDLDPIKGEVKDRVAFTGDKVKIMYRLSEIIHDQKENPNVKPIYDELLSYITG